MVAQLETTDVQVLSTFPTTGPKRIIKPPDDDEFDGDFLPALAVEKVGEMLRLRHNMPTEITITYLWKRKGGKRKSKASLAYCDKVSGLAKYFGAVDFVLWLAADHLRELAFDQETYEALIHHELLHASVDAESLEPIVIGHDFEGFKANIELYGTWLDDYKLARDAFEQSRMFA